MVLSQSLQSVGNNYSFLSHKNEYCTNSKSKEDLKILTNSKYKFYSKSELIYKKNDLSKNFYLIREGVVKISRFFESGNEVTLNLLKKGAIFGILSFLTNGNARESYCAYAFTRVKLEVAPLDSLNYEILKNKNIRSQLLQCFSQRILYSENIIETLNESNKYKKLIRFLIFLSNEFGTLSLDGILINLEITHQSISECIGTCRLTITRQISKLKDQGLIKIKNKRIVIVDLNVLMKYLN
tara:strand:+ start:1770 stop:2489 length:720 start_codon:yes stop_codon:yes gene_type:complete